MMIIVGYKSRRIILHRRIIQIDSLGIIVCFGKPYQDKSLWDVKQWLDDGEDKGTKYKSLICPDKDMILFVFCQLINNILK